MAARSFFVHPLGSRLPAAPLLLLVLLIATVPASGQQFRRGDADASGSREVTDGIRILLHLFSGDRPPQGAIVRGGSRRAGMTPSSFS